MFKGWWDKNSNPIINIVLLGVPAVTVLCFLFIIYALITEHIL